MNHSANTNEQQGEPSWATENWDNPGALGGLDHSSRQYTGPGRLEWDWDPMILAQHPGSGASNDGSDGDRMNNQISAGTMSLRHPYNMLPTGLPSNFNPHNPISMFSTPGIRNFGPLDGSGHLSSSSNLHSVLGSGIPGLAATSVDNDIRNYGQRGREFYPGTGIHDHVKREETSDAHARIGLNLGVRTYFSTEDTVAGRLGKRHRAGSPGSQVPMCQAEGCKADLSTSKQYHRRHKVCENHSKAGNVIVAGHTQRFCQQCSRFHLLGEFDDGKRSCRKRLADHNRRRRKPQPNASQPSAESIGIKSGDDDRANDQKSMLLSMKKSGSPSSVSLEESEEKPGSAGNNLHLRTSGPGFGRGLGDEQRSSHSGMQMSSQPMTGSQSLLNTMSHSPPHILQIPKRQHTLSIAGTGNHGQDHALYHQQYLQDGCWMQGVNSGQTGPNLSLSCLGGGQLGLSHQPGGRGQPLSNQLFSGIDPWPSRTNNLGRSDLRTDGLTQVVGRSGGMNRQHLMATDSKSGITSGSANSPSSQEHDVPVFSPSNQSLLPLQTSRDIASSEWMLGSMTGGQTSRAGSNHFGHSSSINNLTGAGHQMLSLIETSNHNAGSGQGGRTQMEFMQQHTAGADSGGDNNSRGGGSTVDSPDLKYHEDLQPLRNYVSSSIYDSHNLL